MNGEFYVSVILSDGKLGRLIGPDNWERCIACVKELVSDEPEVVEAVDTDGGYDHPDGGGVWIVQAEPLELAEDEDMDSDDLVVELSNGGCMEFDPEDGSIRYRDVDGNTENIWREDEDEYDDQKEKYFPDMERDADDEDEELRRDEKNGLYGGEVDPAN